MSQIKLLYNKMTNRCNGITLKGKCCLRKITLPEIYCYAHKPKNTNCEINIIGECPICFSEIDDAEANKTKIACGHICCFDCLTKLRQLTCPLCRGSLDGLDVNILNNINNNIKKDKEENVERLHQELVRTNNVHGALATMIESFIERFIINDLPNLNTEVHLVFNIFTGENLTLSNEELQRYIDVRGNVGVIIYSIVPTR